MADFTVRLTPDQLAWHWFETCFHFDEDKQYILTYNWCKREVKDFNEFVKDIDWYNESVAQTLWHDASGNLLRS